MTSLRDALAAAEADLAQRLHGESRRPESLIVSRLGFDFLDAERIARWPCDGVAGLARALAGTGALLHHVAVSGAPALILEWLDPTHDLAARHEAMMVWLAARLGVRRLVHLSAATSLQGSLAPGQVAVAADHVRWSGDDPLIGWDAVREGARFPQMTDLYDADLRAAARAGSGGAIAEAVVLVRRGPCGPTAAEYRAFARLGADVVAESGANEALAARHAGLRCGALLLVLHRASEVPEPGLLARRADLGLPAMGERLAAMLHAPETDLDSRDRGDSPS